MSSDPFKAFNALYRLVADRERLLRDAGPAIEMVRQHEEALRHAAEALKLNAAAVSPAIKQMMAEIHVARPWVEKVTAEIHAARPWVESMQRTLFASADHMARLQAAVDTPAAREFARLAEPSKGLAAWMREVSKIQAAIHTPAFEEAQRVAASIAAAMPPLAEMTPERFGVLFPEGSADEAWQRFAAKAGAIAHDAATDQDAIIALAEEADAVTAATPAGSKDRVALLVQMVLLALLVDLLKDGIKSGANALLPYLLALPLLFQPIDSPALPASPSYDLQAVVPRAAPGDALVVVGGWQIEGLPDVIRRAGPRASLRTLEFFTAQIRNPNTRQAYQNAVLRFFNWCDDQHLEVAEITPFAVAAYIDEMQAGFAAPTIKQHLAAIRMLFDYLVVGQVVPMNPAASVRGPKHVVKKGKTSVLQPDEARTLLDSIDVGELAGLRDRALLGVMVYSFARVSAVVRMNVEDYYQQGKRWCVRLHEKGGKYHEVPVHHKAEEYLDAYIEAGGLSGEEKKPLWRSLSRKKIRRDEVTKRKEYALGESRMTRTDVLRMVYRRVEAAGLGDHASCHTLRATGITAYLLNGGTLEKAQTIAAHESPRTTKLYDRTSDEITLDEIERIAI